MTTTGSAIGVVADDLTGAADATVQFAAAGWQAAIGLAGAPPHGAPGCAFAIVTDSRDSAGEQARGATLAAVTALQHAGYHRVYVKIDSVLRGPVAGQILGALQAWAPGHPGALAVLCPAYPSMGRVVEAGRVMVRTPGADGSVAVAGPDASAVVPGSVRVPVPTSRTPGAWATQLEAARQAGARVALLDAASNEDLDAIATALVRCGEWIIPVGSAGLAAALSRVWPAPAGRVRPAAQSVPSRRATGRTLVVVSSRHPVSSAQLAALVGDPGARALLLELAPGAADVRNWIDAALAAEPSPPAIVALRPPRLAVEAGAATHDLLEALAEAADAALDRLEPEALVLVGGDGARHVLHRLRAQRLDLRGTLREGLPWGFVIGGRGDGLTLATKSGGFGTPSDLIDAVRDLRSPPEGNSRQ